MRYCEQCGAAFRFARSCPKDNVATSAGAFDPLIGRVLGDRYRILDRIGAGGMGQVYRAAHTRIACVFAVKVVWGDFAYDAAMQTRFVREAEVASCLQSRHIVRVIDFAHEASSLPYLVMEHLDGPTLYDVIAREGPLSTERAARIATAIARGLSHAHDRGVVHRDLKPENVILVTEDDERDVVKILDFGIARLQDDDRLTGMGISVGTPIYMAPEQLSAGNVDGRADLYSLGIVLFEMLTGKPPFNANNLQDLTRLHFQQPAPSIRPRLQATGGNVALDDIVRRLLAKRADDRFSSARELIEALAPAAAPRPTIAPPVVITSARAAPVETAITLLLRKTILEGAPRYNTGDHAGCYDLYRGVAEQIVRSGTMYAAVSARLQAGLLRGASRSNPTDAAWDMRYAFDDLLMAEAVPIQNDVMSDEFSVYVSVSQGRESEGKFDVLGDYQISFALALAARLKSDPRRASEVATLEDAARRGREAGGGQAAVHVIDPVLARIRSGGSLATSGAVRIAPSVPPISSSAVSEDVRQAIFRAIRAGAPAYEQGQPDVCERIYRQTAMEIVASAPATPATPLTTLLNAALRDANGRAPSEAAWVFRRAFDAILASA